MPGYLALAAAAFAGAAVVLLAPPGRPARDRLDRAVTCAPDLPPGASTDATGGGPERAGDPPGMAGREPAADPGHEPAGQPRGATRPRAARGGLALVAGGVAGAVLLGGWVGVILGLTLGLGADRLLRRSQTPAERDRRRRERADLPLAADLLAATLRAGAPVDRAVAEVAAALDGPLAERLSRVARSLRLGADAPEAWEHLAAVPGGERVVRIAVRSSASGAALAAALGRLADDLRVARAAAAEAAARRAGVLLVLPLGLCFLPAFILAGLVPVIVAILGDVL